VSGLRLIGVGISRVAIADAARGNGARCRVDGSRQPSRLSFVRGDTGLSSPPKRRVVNAVTARRDTALTHGCPASSGESCSAQCARLLDALAFEFSSLASARAVQAQRQHDRFAARNIKSMAHLMTDHARVQDGALTRVCETLRPRSLCVSRPPGRRARDQLGNVAQIARVTRSTRMTFAMPSPIWAGLVRAQRRGPAQGLHTRPS